MIRLLVFCFVLLPLLSSAQTPVVSSGTLTHIPAFQSRFVKPHTVDIWLPQGYTKKKKYAVLYMQDGSDLFDSSLNELHVEWQADETITRLIKQDSIRNCIVVAIWSDNKTRHSEYMPQKPFESLSQKQQDSMYDVKVGKSKMLLQKVQSDNYLKFIVQELKPYVDSNYSTSKKMEHTFIAGSSMGGLISMYALCEYPKVFGGAACLSTWWPGLLPSKNNVLATAIENYLLNSLPSPSTHKIYVDCGTVMEDYAIKPLQEKMDSVLYKKGYVQGKNFMSLVFTGARHTTKEWQSRFSIPLVFLLKK